MGKNVSSQRRLCILLNLNISMKTMVYIKHTSCPCFPHGNLTGTLQQDNEASSLVNLIDSKMAC